MLNKIIGKMLKQNTGIHFLDSGFEDGRHWQKNQNIDFAETPEVELSFKYGEIEFTRNVYHYLVNSSLKFEEKLTKKLRKIERKKDTFGMYANEEFAKWYTNKNGGEFNTFNGEDNLSQVLQYTVIDGSDCDRLIILQIHNGADVRGGYTHGVVFSDYYEEFHPFPSGNIYCQECEENWYTDDGFNWYIANTAELDLHEYDLNPINPIMAKFANLLRVKTDYNINQGVGKLYTIGKDAICPCCGLGMLDGSL